MWKSLQEGGQAWAAAADKYARVRIGRLASSTSICVFCSAFEVFDGEEDMFCQGKQRLAALRHCAAVTSSSWLLARESVLYLLSSADAGAAARGQMGWTRASLLAVLVLVVLWVIVQE